MFWAVVLAFAVWALLANNLQAIRFTLGHDTLALEASSGSLSLRAEGLPPAAQLTVSWTPSLATRTITFATESLTSILVRPGQVLKVGDLLGYASASAQERIAELERRLVAVEDALVRAEVLAEIQRLRAENEVRALIPGRVLRVDVEQQGARLHVRVVVQSP